jgi:hypothetical protein
VLPAFIFADQIETEQTRRSCALQGSGAPCRMRYGAESRGSRSSDSGR